MRSCADQCEGLGSIPFLGKFYVQLGFQPVNLTLLCLSSGLICILRRFQIVLIMKKFFLFFACLTVISGAAQNSTLKDLIADFERSKTMSLEYIEAMPEDKFNFKPSEGSRTFAAQMLHLAQGTIGLTSNGTGATPIYGDMNIEQEVAFHTKSEVRRLVTESFDFALENIKNMDPGLFDEIVVRGPFKVTRLGWIQKANEHAGHHRGQCAVYLRLQGITPPSYKLF